MGRGGAAAGAGASGTADYPLMLISPASDRRISSTLGVSPARAAPRLMMHPRDAAARGLAHGGDVRVWNERGEVILPLDVTDDVPPGVVASEKGAWLATSRTGQTISALVSADMRADLAEGACFNDTRVEVCTVIAGASRRKQSPSAGRYTDGDCFASLAMTGRHRGSVLVPIRNSSTARAHWRPSRIAHTTSDWPRRMSPAANTLSTEVR